MRKMQGSRKWNYHAFRKFLEISTESAERQDSCRTVLPPLRKGGKRAQRNRDESAACARPTFHRPRVSPPSPIVPTVKKPRRLIGLWKPVGISKPPSLSGRTQSTGHGPHRWPRDDFLLDVQDARPVPVYQTGREVGITPRTPQCSGPAGSIQVSATKETRSTGEGMTGALTKTSGGAKRDRGGVLIDIRTKNIKYCSILY